MFNRDRVATEFGSWRLWFTLGVRCVGFHDLEVSVIRHPDSKFRSDWGFGSQLVIVNLLLEVTSRTTLFSSLFLRLGLTDTRNEGTRVR